MRAASRTPPSAAAPSYASLAVALVAERRRSLASTTGSTTKTSANASLAVALRRPRQWPARQPVQTRQNCPPHPKTIKLPTIMLQRREPAAGAAQPAQVGGGCTTCGGRRDASAAATSCTQPRVDVENTSFHPNDSTLESLSTARTDAVLALRA
eukprot:CAMPEP_0118924816 /NCGR_PEP_ID=MMETSP1169-20130426/2774_1 /TAXON_ID=36882 /ORGANISM="Pyramimonas obovata, Strain CCMP722" /LENGTH=153 /DNA_ID=CAMNT_0006865951 /DNA_START=137 /DNA_END=595 /DNA_ORIENTATION=-